MDISAFAKHCKLFDAQELDKVSLLAYFHHKKDGTPDFSTDDVIKWFGQLDLPHPNKTRLRTRLEKSREFVKHAKGRFKLHPTKRDELQSLYPGVHSESEEVQSDDLVLPRTLYENTRGFIESLAKQINASYEYNIYDGCAVLMRRLLEIVLILTYEHLNCESEIKDSTGQYHRLESIIGNARSNSKLALTKDTRDVIDDFRELGNFSAHKIYYNCRRADLKGIVRKYRASIEEFLYKAGIKK